MARQVYLTIVRSALSYGASLWHTPSESPTSRPRGPAVGIRAHQNSCLRTVLGAFKATPIRQLETEAYIPPFDLWLNGRVAYFQARLELTGIGQQIKDACTIIKLRIRARRKRQRRRTAGEVPAKTPGTKRRIWVEKWAGTQLSHWDQRVDRRVLADWKDRWKDAVDKLGRVEQLGTGPVKRWVTLVDTPPTKQVLKLHEGLRKAESSLLIQVRTGKIGLNKFLYSRRVPGYSTAQCQCRGGEETPRHIALFCIREADRRYSLRPAGGGPVDYRRLVGSNEGARVITEWMMRSGRLGQFALARRLLFD